MNALKFCSECSYEFLSGFDKIKHVITHMPYEEYIIKNFYGGIHPLCKCGCGTKLSFKANKEFPFFSDYTKNHFPRKKHTDEVKEKIKVNSAKAIKEKFGVDNVMNLPEYIAKIATTKLKKYGNSKYNNITKNIDTQSKAFFDKIVSGDRLTDDVIPMFTQEEYKGITGRYLFKCLNCNDNFEDTLDNGHVPRCPECKPFIKSSEAENEIFSWIKELLPGELILKNNRSVFKGKYELDIYIPSRKISIEFNGLYWHSENLGEKDRKYHLNKLQGCEDLGIQLIQVFEDEWIYKKDLIKSKIKHILGFNNDNRMHARKCAIIEITTAVKDEFLRKNHIQGNDQSQINIGLFHKDILVAVMTFCKPRVALGNKSYPGGTWELSRFATSSNVIGGAGKLMKYFIKTYKPLKIITYADRRWTTSIKDNLYDKIGFIFNGKTHPNYWYMKDYSTRLHRFNFTKKHIINKLNGDQSLSEWENMKKLKYDRIWDCGSLKYVYIPSC